MTIREHGGSPKRVGFSSSTKYSSDETGQSGASYVDFMRMLEEDMKRNGDPCQKCKKGTLVPLTKEGKKINKCDSCAAETDAL